LWTQKLVAVVLLRLWSFYKSAKKKMIRVRIVASHFAKCEVISRFGDAKIFF